MENQSNENEIDLFKWITGILITVLFAFTSIIYTSLVNADNIAKDSIIELESYQTSDNARFQNLEANVYLLCKAQKLDCIPPVK